LQIKEIGYDQLEQQSEEITEIRINKKGDLEFRFGFAVK
jgi:hypothetical protein